MSGFSGGHWQGDSFTCNLIKGEKRTQQLTLGTRWIIGSGTAILKNLQGLWVGFRLTHWFMPTWYDSPRGQDVPAGNWLIQMRTHGLREVPELVNCVKMITEPKSDFKVCTLPTSPCFLIFVKKDTRGHKAILLILYVSMKKCCLPYQQTKDVAAYPAITWEATLTLSLEGTQDGNRCPPSAAAATPSGAPWRDSGWESTGHWPQTAEIRSKGMISESPDSCTVPYTEKH